MRIAATLFLLVIIMTAQSQEISDSTIRAYKIYEITETTTHTNKANDQSHRITGRNTTTYNERGFRIKSVNTGTLDASGIDSTVTLFFYHDTLLARIEWKGFSGKKLVENGYESYSWTFDELNRKTSTSVKDQNGRETREVYIWSKANNIDTIYYLTNDSAVYVPQRSGYDFLRGKGLHLSRIVINYRSPENTLVKYSECQLGCKWKYINDTLCCTTTELTTNGDTAIQRIRFFNHEWQTWYRKQSYASSGALLQESERGDKSITFFQKNNKKLLVKKEVFEIKTEGYFMQSVTTYRYKFRRN